MPRLPTETTPASAQVAGTSLRPAIAVLPYLQAAGLWSIGSKLAGATIALIMVLTAGIYLRLSQYQRESLLRAKEASATAVSRLFADSCAAAVVFDDRAALRDELATLGRDKEVEYAAVWAVDAGGHVSHRLAEVGSGRPEAVTVVPSAMQIRRNADRVVPTSPVRDLNGRPVAVTVAAFSLAAENAAIARLEKTMLLISCGIGAGLALLLMGMARVVVVGPLAKLARAAKRLEEGRDADIDVRKDDEVGRLAAALRSMATAIRAREAVISAGNRDMRLVLDNVGQGFITLDLSGTMSAERSRVLDDWFGAAEGSPKFWEYLRRVDAAAADYFEVGWWAVVDQIMPLELCLEQLPKVVRSERATLELAYKPIFSDGAFCKAIIIISDITMRLDRERSEERQREIMNMYRRLTADREGFRQFFAEASALVQAIAETTGIRPLQVIERQVHTMKGNCALFGIESMAALCHEIEERMADAGVLTEVDQSRLRAAWARTCDMRAELVGHAGDDGLTVSRQEYDMLFTQLSQRASHDDLVALAQSWEFEAASRRLAMLREEIQSLASRCGRAQVNVICQPTTLRLPPRRWGPFWSAFSHVIRNTVDHGVQTVDERLAAGRPAQATVKLGIARRPDAIMVTVEDDGPGIDWDGLARRARDRGLAADTLPDLEAALFADGISSRSDVTQISGRGVGLAAFRASMVELGGRVELTSAPGTGTILRCWLPEAMLSSDAPSIMIAPDAQIRGLGPERLDGDRKIRA